MTDIIRLILEALFIPIAIALVIWAVTQRKRDRAEVKKTLADAGKIEAEGTVAHETVEAAVQLAEITTLKEGVAAMVATFREERESMRNRLESATLAAQECAREYSEMRSEMENMKADVERYHREVLDMYRRDLYHAHAVRILTEWISDNLPKLLKAFPDLPKPPQIDPLPPLHINPEEDLPSRRWYDTSPAVNPNDQEI